MSKTTFGEVDYSNDFGGGDKKNNKDLFLRLVDGDNELRLVTSPYQYLSHKFKKDVDSSYGRKVGCSKVNGSCPLCDLVEKETAEGSEKPLAEKAKQRWFYGVIDRKTGQYKVLDVGWQVFSQIKKYANNPKWGEPTKYDIDIIVDKGNPSAYYTVQPVPKEPLSAADQQIKDNADLDDLKRRCTPLTSEQVQKRMDWISGAAEGGATASAATTATVPDTTVKNTPKSITKVVTKPVSVPEVIMTDDDGDEDFPSFDGN